MLNGNAEADRSEEKQALREDARCFPERPSAALGYRYPHPKLVRNVRREDALWISMKQDNEREESLADYLQ